MTSTRISNYLIAAELHLLLANISDGQISNRISVSNFKEVV